MYPLWRAIVPGIAVSREAGWWRVPTYGQVITRWRRFGSVLSGVVRWWGSSSCRILSARSDSTMPASSAAARLTKRMSRVAWNNSGCPIASIAMMMSMLTAPVNNLADLVPALFLFDFDTRQLQLVRSKAMPLAVAVVAVHSTAGSHRRRCAFVVIVPVLAGFEIRLPVAPVVAAGRWMAKLSAQNKATTLSPALLGYGIRAMLISRLSALEAVPPRVKFEARTRRNATSTATVRRELLAGTENESVSFTGRKLCSPFCLPTHRRRRWTPRAETKSSGARAKYKQMGQTPEATPSFRYTTKLSASSFNMLRDLAWRSAVGLQTQPSTAVRVVSARLKMRAFGTPVPRRRHDIGTSSKATPMDSL